MSQLNVDAIRSANGTGDAISLTAADKTCTANITNNLSNRRLNINGDFRVMQRGTQTSVTAGKYGIDRWKFEVGNCGTWTLSQDTDVPAGKGFAKSYKIQCTTADASPAAADYVDTRYKFEGQDLQGLKWGGSDAKSITVTFWIKCKKTGTFNLNLLANGAANKSLGKVITISTADTWEFKSVTFAGDTAQAIICDNALRLSLVFWLDAGSDYKGGTSPTSAWETLTSANRAASTTIALADNTANYVNLCGVQIEAGDYATDFEYTRYFDERHSCERYYRRVNFGVLFSAYHAWNHSSVQLTGMRAVPTVTRIGNSISSTQSSATISVDTGSSNSANDPWYVQLSSASSDKLGTGGFYSADAEL